VGQGSMPGKVFCSIRDHLLHFKWLCSDTLYHW